MPFPTVQQMNLHLKILDGGNNHHMAEALFKAFGKALDMAVSPSLERQEYGLQEVWLYNKRLTQCRFVQIKN